MVKSKSGVAARSFWRCNAKGSTAFRPSGIAPFTAPNSKGVNALCPNGLKTVPPIMRHPLVSLNKNLPPIMKKITTLALLLLSSSVHFYAQPGTLDPTFGTAGKTTSEIGPTNEYARAVAVQADGKIVVAGDTYTNNTVLEDFALARYNPDGTLDNSFGVNGFVVTDLQQATDVATAIAIQPDGKIVVAGYSDNTLNYDFAIARYLANGTLDNSFGANGKVIKNFGSTDFGLALALLPNGKIVVAGRAYNGNNGDFALLQLNPNGSFDNSFGTNGALMSDLFGADESANAIVLQADGKIVAVGDRYANNASLFAVARFNPDGSLDPGFSFDGKLSTGIGTVSDVAYAVAIQTDGKIVVAGQSNGTTISDFALARYLSDGTPDVTFSADGQLSTSISNGGDYAFAIAIQPDGKILAGGSASGANSISDFAVARYLADGNLDQGFGTGGIGLADFNTGRDGANAMVLHQGKIIMAGYSDKNSQSAFALARFLGGASVGIEETEADPGLQIFPNPGNEFVQLRFPKTVSGEIQVLSVTGQIMYKDVLNAEERQINVANWPCGWYFVQCNTENQIWRAGKFLKHGY